MIILYCCESLIEGISKVGCREGVGAGRSKHACEAQDMRLKPPYEVLGAFSGEAKGLLGLGIEG